jgi:hypothetical protein
MTDLVVLDAWQVGEQDLASAAILESDDVVIPASHSEDAPVLELLRKRRKPD